MAAVRGEKVTGQIADEKGHLTYCSERICTLDRARASMHFA